MKEDKKRILFPLYNKKMVLSEILKPAKIDYDESNQLDKKDKDHTSALYLVELLNDDKEYVVALGAPRMEHADKGVVYYPIYLVSAKNRIKAKIGVFEVETAKTISLVDDDGDIDLNKLGDPLLFSFATEEYLDRYGSKHAEEPEKEEDAAKEEPKEPKEEIEEIEEIEEEEEEEEEDEIDQLKKGSKEKDQKSKILPQEDERITLNNLFIKEDPLPTVSSWPTETREDSAKMKETFKKNKSTTSNWVVNFMKNKEYKIHPVESNGDCFFATVRDAFAQIGYKTTVGKLRKILSQEVTVELYENYKAIYEGISNERKHADEEIQRLEKVNKELKNQSEKTNNAKHQQDILNEAVKTKQEYALQKMQKGGADELLQEFGFMEHIHSKEDLIEYVQTSSYWITTWGISQLELLLSVKFIIMEETEDYDSVIRCTQANDDKHAYAAWDPKYYIMVNYTTIHYELVSYKDKKIFLFGEVPYDMKVKVIKACIENNENIYYAKIPAFRQFRSELGIPEQTEKEQTEKEEKEEEKQSVHLFDPELVISFHANSAKNALPGKIDGDTIPIQRMNEFAVLKNTLLWRRKLDDSWSEDPFTMKDDGTRWNSVAHYLLAVKFKVSHPAVYAMFSDDSNSDISKDLAEAKNSLTKRVGKYYEVNKDTAPLDEGVLETYRKDALRSKFDVKTDMGRMLQSTFLAKLVQFRKNTNPKPDITLMEVRAEGLPQQ